MLNRLTKHQKTKILPLLWIGNFLGEIAGNHLVEAIHMGDHDDQGFVYRYHCLMWKVLNKPYEWWGEYYTIDMEAWREDLTEGESQDS